MKLGVWRVKGLCASVGLQAFGFVPEVSGRHSETGGKARGSMTETLKKKACRVYEGGYFHILSQAVWKNWVQNSSLKSRAQRLRSHRNQNKDDFRISGRPYESDEFFSVSHIPLSFSSDQNG